MSDSSSSSLLSSTDRLSFILEESSDDTEMLKYVLDDKTDIKIIELLMKWRQATQANGALSSSRKPRKKKRFIRRDREEPHQCLYKDYFAEDSIYNESHFRSKFRMRRHLFIPIVDALSTHYEYFQQRYDDIGRQGLSPLTKCTAVM